MPFRSEQGVECRHELLAKTIVGEHDSLEPPHSWTLVHVEFVCIHEIAYDLPKPLHGVRVEVPRNVDADEHLESA